jgi:tetratricopeptide (TPR) repeat protein
VSSSKSDPRVPLYLGRILDASGSPVGTCFQLEPGVLITAWHVLEQIEAGTLGAAVVVDSLAGAVEPRSCAVSRVDELADLAVLETEVPLLDSVGGISGTDDEDLGVQVVATGVSAVEDPGRSYSYLDAIGITAGGTTRDDATPLGRIRSQDVVPGMSGAPVRRVADDVVVGVVSGRYNSTDGWLRDSIWLARCEQMTSLARGLTSVHLESVPADAPIDITLEVSEEEVRLQGSGLDVRGSFGGVSSRLSGVLGEIDRARALSRNAGARFESDLSALADGAGLLLGEAVLSEPLRTALGEVLSRAERHHQAVRVGVCEKGSLPLPWELLPDPRSNRALALNPLVSLYRRFEASPATRRPGPLRILVSISSPERGGGALLDYERELRNVIAAVRAARQGEAHVRLVPFATTAAIRAELEADPVHVLHLSGHGSPGYMTLEDAKGNSRQVDADTFIDEAIPPGAMPWVFGLSACFTNTKAESDASSFATRLMERGASAVIATETSLTDVFSTRLFSRTYGHLASSSTPDVVAAACEARRTVQAELELSGDERHRRLASLSEWSSISVLATAGSIVPIEPGEKSLVPPPPPRLNIGAVTARAVGEFVGRRTEQRQWPAELIASGSAGMALYGIGGVGKTTLAAELVNRIIDDEPDRAYTVLSGSLSVNRMLSAVVSALRQRALVSEQLQGDLATALAVASRSDLSGSDRLSILRDHVLGRIPLLLVLDNFEDNLTRDGGRASVSDENLAALLADWVLDPRASRLLLTSRYPFELPEGAADRLGFRTVGPLSAAETAKLVWSLPALDRLTAEEVGRVWRLVGGHPRSLEYVDALLQKGAGRYRDVTDRLKQAIVERLGSEKAGDHLNASWKLDEAMAEVATIAADDVLLDRLYDELGSVPRAQELLVGVSVYREPVDTNAVLFQVGEVDEGMASIPDRRKGGERIREILDAAGVDADLLDQSVIDVLPAGLKEELLSTLEDMNRPPKPGLSPPEGLGEASEACESSSLLAVVGNGAEQRFFVHRWTAGELARKLSDSSGPSADIGKAHREAAAYWRWRAKYWPQPLEGDLHDATEARFHYLAAEDIDGAAELNTLACALLHQQGAWDDQEMLIREMLELLPGGEVREAELLVELGGIAFSRGDLDEAQRVAEQALELGERNDYSSMVAGALHSLGKIAEIRGKLTEAEDLYRRSLDLMEGENAELRVSINLHHLGNLALARGEEKKAEAEYQAALEIAERLDYLPGISAGLHQFGLLARDRDDLDEAERLYRRALTIEERLSHPRGVASSLHQLGSVAQAKGAFEDAEKLYLRSLELEEKIGNLAGVGTSFGQLGTLAMVRGDLDSAESFFRRALEIEVKLEERPEIAKTFSQLAILAARRDERERAVQWEAQALVLRLEASPRDLPRNLLRLDEHREILGREKFNSLVEQAVDADSASRVFSLLEAWREAVEEEQQPGEEGSGPK